MLLTTNNCLIISENQISLNSQLTLARLSQANQKQSYFAREDIRCVFCLASSTPPFQHYIFSWR